MLVGKNNDQKRLCDHFCSLFLPIILLSPNTRIFHVWIFPGACISAPKLCLLLLRLLLDMFITCSRRCIKRGVAGHAKPTIIYREYILLAYQSRTQNRIVLPPRNISIRLTLSLSMATYIACPIAPQNVAGFFLTIIRSDHYDYRSNLSRLLLSIVIRLLLMFAFIAC